ncbi:MAG: replication-associated recombination protein A [Actinomycetota bacterium]
MADDLFAAAAQDHREQHAPLADRLRPVRLDDVVGQDHLLGEGAPLRTLIEADRLPSIILWGPAGTGKTTLARVIARTTARAFEELSAVSASVKDVRRIAAEAEARLGERAVRTILFLDEVHRFSRSQQDALLPHVESGLLTLIGATTENPFFSVNGPLLSRATLFRLESIDLGGLDRLIDRALPHLGVDIEPGGRAHLVRTADGDGRSLLTSLELAGGLAAARGSTASITLADAEAAVDQRALGYGDDGHYDVTSALIKSIRGSDVDAGLYWLARMLAAGDDPRFIARRLVILASEDIGIADHTSLLVAEAAARAVDFVGLPEARLTLAHAVVHLARAPKSNAVTVALGAAESDVHHGVGEEVPIHLRDAHYSGAARLGHGEGYRYPHDHPGGWVEQRYRPAGVEDRVYYRPTGRGEERELGPASSGPSSDTVEDR